MNYVEAPQEPASFSIPSVFLAGTITGSSDWQTEICQKIKDLNITVFNPRRKNFPIHDPKAAEAQITWEYNYLRKVTFISFWFAKETIGPIVLFELGAHSMTTKPLVVGVDPEYPRRQDVEIQMKLIRPELKIVYSLDDVATQIQYQTNYYS